MEPRVFYGPPKARTHSPPRKGSGSGSEAETEIEEPIKKFKRLHRRLESTDSTFSSSSGERQDRKRSKTSQHKVSARDTHGRQPLQRACARGDFERVKTLVLEGADVLDRDYAGTTALHSAALQGEPEVVKFLLENGAIADIRSGPDELDTPLMDAVSSSNIPVIKLLLEHGADPRVQNAEGKTTVDFIDEEADEAQEIHRLLKQESLKARKQGPPIQDPADGPRGMFPPQTTSQSQTSGPGASTAGPAAGSRSRRRNDLLWFDVTTRTGRMEVCKRAAQGDIEYIGMSLEHGWQPSAEALVQAAKFGHTDIVGLLLAFGKSPDDLYDGVTALHETIGRGHLEVVKLLIEGGADPKWRDSNGIGYIDLVKDLPPDDEERKYIETICGSKPEKKKHERAKEIEKHKETRSEKVGTPDEEKRREPEPRSESKTESKTESKPEPKADTKPEPKVKSEEPGKDYIAAPEPLKPKETRVRFDTSGKPIEYKERKPVERTTPSVSPRSTPPPIPQKSAEEIKRLEELAAKREQARKAREAEMLSALEKQEQRAAERRERLSGEFERRASPVLPPTSAGAASDAISTASPVLAPGAVAALPSPAALSEDATPLSDSALSPTTDTQPRIPFSKVSSLPYGLRALSVLGSPQDAQPLFVYKRKDTEYVLDVQVALVLGKARLHAEYPDLTKVPVTTELPALWGLVFTWMAPRGATWEVLQSERAKFEALKLNWIPLKQVRELPGAENTPTVQISLQSPPALHRPPSSSYENIPLRLSAQMSANRASSQWR